MISKAARALGSAIEGVARKKESYADRDMSKLWRVEGRTRPDSIAGQWSVESGSIAMLIEEIGATSKQGEIKLTLNDEAKLLWVRFWAVSEVAMSMEVTASLGKGASLRIVDVMRLGGGAAVRSKISVTLEGVGADVSVTLRAAQAQGSQLCAPSVVWIKPLAREAKARQFGWAIRSEEGTVSLLEPNLVVEQDDVEASHGVATGPIEERDLFALKSKGIEERAAKSMLERAFLAQAIDAMEGEVAPEALEHLREVAWNL